MSNQRKTYEERMAELEKKEQDSLKKAKQYSAQKKALDSQ